MKKQNFLLVLLLLANSILFAQVGVNKDGSAPVSSAMLDMKSTDQGLLIPRVSTAARDLLPSPATGLLIYNTNTNRFNYYNGSFWFQIETAFLSSTTGTLNPGGGVSVNALPDVLPDNSAVLDINNPTRGILLPRTVTELITAPATGLLIYNTATNFLSYYDGARWVSLCAVSTGIAGAGGSQAPIGMAVKTDNSSPHQSAMLDVSAPNKGVLIPRLTNTERNAILPVAGLVIYNTSVNIIEFFNGSAWFQLITNLFAPPTAGTHIPGADQIIWNWNIVAGSTGYKWNTANDYNTATDMDYATSKTETGLACGNNYTRYVWAYNACGHTSEVTLTQSTYFCTTCSPAITVNHLVSKGVAPVDKTVTYSIVAYIPGEIAKCWIASNLGADHQATAKDDATEASAGWYWQFNRKQGYRHDGTDRTPNTSWTTAINENLDWQAASDPCAIELGGGWRIPTKSEWDNVHSAGGWGNWNGPWNSGLKLHAAGNISFWDGSLSSRGIGGDYRSSQQVSPTNQWSLTLGSNYGYMREDNKAYGFSMRCIKDSYPLLMVPGGYQGWNPADSSTTVASLKLDEKYEGYLWFNGDYTEYKYTRGPSWAVNWGDNNADGTLELFGANIFAGVAGYYRLQVDMNSMTHSFFKTIWSVVGPAAHGDWNSDSDMSFNPVTKVWTINLDLDTGVFKFRANHDWTLNYGDNGANGTLDEGGENIAVPGAGNYTIIFNLSKPVYTYQLIKSAFVCGATFTVYHLTGTIAPVTKTVNYGTVTNIPGETSKCWITRNLGADHQATAKDDATEASAGWYWQFNRKQGYKHDGTNRTPDATWITPVSENSDWQALNDPCALEIGNRWRIPTKTEWENVDLGGPWVDWNGPWNSGLKLHAAGDLYNSTGTLYRRGVGGSYWSSTQVNNSQGWFLLFNNAASEMINYYPKASGYSLRCIQDCYAAPNAPRYSVHVPQQNQVIWNWNTVAGATGYKWNTSNDYSSASDMFSATTKTETGLTCNTLYTRYAWAYNGCGNSTPVTLIKSTTACSSFSCGSPITVDHQAGVIAPVYKTVTYGTVTNIPGETSKCWITSNLGADHQATAVDDATEASAGWYWQFNRKQGFKFEGTTRTPGTSWINPINENLDWEPANDPCALTLGTGWRVPTSAEWTNVDATGLWTDWNGPWNSGLKLHGAGNLYFTDGVVNVRGGRGFYWSSTQSSLDLGHNIGFDNSSCGMGLGPNYKSNGFTIRCIK